MNQILINDYEKNIKIRDLNKNLKTLKNIIIILLLTCITLTGVLVYRIYNMKIEKSTNKNNNLNAFVGIDNTTNNNIELPETINKDIEIENIINESNNIETTNTISQTNISDTNKINNENNTNVYKTSNGEKYTIIARLKIPSINIDMNVLSSTSNALLKISLNKYWGANPNEVGNMCIVGHNYENGTHFSNLSKVKLGDTIEIIDNNNITLKYTVYDTYIIDPYDTSCTSQLTNGKTEITLITCHNSGKQRFVVKARA